MFESIVILYPQISPEKLISKEALLANEYGRDEEIPRLQTLFQQLTPKPVEIVKINLLNYKAVLDSLKNTLVVNLCDGTEEDGFPGLTVVKYLENLRLPFTGSDSRFFYNTTSKPVLKRLLEQSGVSTAAFVEIRPENIENCVDQAAEIVKFPMIIKPSISYASISISKDSVVDTKHEAISQIKKVIQDNPDGIFVETFLAGKEFSAVVTGSEKAGVVVYPVAERVFNPELPEREKILAFDQYWDGYDLEGGKGNGSVLYWYALAAEEWQKELQKIAKEAYLACEGNGYGRVDIRTRNRNELDAVVLEVIFAVM